MESSADSQETMPASADAERAPSADGRAGLGSAGFLGLLVTQFLGAVNDNVFRWLAIGIGKDYVQEDQVALVLSAGTICFVLPYLILAAPAGYLADRHRKRTVIVGCKVAEIVLMLLGILAIHQESIYALFAVLALLGSQAALFGPAKLGSIPEMLRPEKISAANGLMGLVTVVATVVGGGAGNFLYDYTRPLGQNHLGTSALVLVGIAVVGWATSLAILRLPSAAPTLKFPWNAAGRTWADLKTLFASRALVRVALGVAFFWSIGSMAQMNIDQFGFEGGLRQKEIVPLLISLVVGVGLGSVLAGYWSGGKVELGILPLGAAGVAISSMSLFLVHGTLANLDHAHTASFAWACVLLFLLGTSAGLFSVPLESFLQHRSPPASRGSILAASNFVTFAGILLSAGMFAMLRAPLLQGSIDQVEQLAEIRPARGSPQARRVEREIKKYEAERRAGKKPRIESALNAARSEDHPLVLAELLWRELAAEKARDAMPRASQLVQRFPGDESLVTELHRQAIGLPLFSARQIFLLAGLGTLPVFFYIVLLLPQASIRFMVWLASRTIYRVRVHGPENLPEEGGALLASNHVSWVDGILLLVASSRPVRLVVRAELLAGAWVRWLARTMGVIAIEPGKKSVLESIRLANESLLRGELVCVFPEGQISRTGELQEFQAGMLAMVEGTSAPIVPVYLDELWGSIFSFQGGKFFWKWPRRWPYPMSISFGRPIQRPEHVQQVRQAVQALGLQAVEKRTSRDLILPRTFLRTCRRSLRRPKIADSMGTELTGGTLLLRTLILRRLLLRHVLSRQERFVGLLLPPSVGAVVANAAIPLAGRIAVNLNYTVSVGVMNACLAQCDIRHVLTSRAFVQKAKLDTAEIRAEIVYLEDFAGKVTLADKVLGACQTYATPVSWLERRFGLHRLGLDDLLTIVFTSGSTGEPKGVMLSHGNVLSNVKAIEQLVQINQHDVLVGVLPFFHSMGYTATMWTVLALDLKGVYHFSPLDARQVGKLSRKHDGTLLICTPTFLRLYLKACQPEDFAKLDVVMAGAEKLPVDLAAAFEQKFGIRPVEGYGTTELSPLVSFNIPPSRALASGVPGAKEGTVGRPIPGVQARITNTETGEVLGANQPGMLWIKGPNVMQGYWQQPELTAQVIRDGWYMTGDIALLDAEGFIQITGRESRFSKIGGEMVPHIKIEETLQRVLESGEEHLCAVVSAVPDERKGERLVVLHTALDKSPLEICKLLQQAGLPQIWIPSPDSFCQVAEIPVLGTGKLDLKALKAAALAHFGPDGAGCKSAASDV